MLEQLCVNSGLLRLKSRLYDATADHVKLQGQAATCCEYQWLWSYFLHLRRSPQQRPLHRHGSWFGADLCVVSMPDKLLLLWLRLTLRRCCWKRGFDVAPACLRLVNSRPRRPGGFYDIVGPIMLLMLYTSGGS